MAKETKLALVNNRINPKIWENFIDTIPKSDTIRRRLEESIEENTKKYPKLRKEEISV